MGIEHGSNTNFYNVINLAILLWTTREVPRPGKRGWEMEPMYLCDECLKQYQKRSPVHDSEEKQESTHCDECAKKERELTFPMYWIIPFWEIAPNSGPTFGFFMVDRRPATMRNRFPKKAVDAERYV